MITYINKDTIVMITNIKATVMITYLMKSCNYY